MKFRMGCISAKSNYRAFTQRTVYPIGRGGSTFPRSSEILMVSLFTTELSKWRTKCSLEVGSN